MLSRLLPLVALSMFTASTALAEPPHAAPPPAAPAPAPAVKAPAAPQAAQQVSAVKPSIVLAAAKDPKAPPPKPAMELKPQSSDPGIKISQNGNRILVSGTAAGPKVKYLDTIAYENGKRVKQVDYEVARGVSFTVDHEKMPDFSKDADYTRKNAWYFAHLATTGTHEGESAGSVAQRLAASLNKGNAYKATVEMTADGAAISLQKK